MPEGEVMRAQVRKWTRTAIGAGLAAALLAACTGHSAEQSHSVGRAAAAQGELNCNETEETYHEKGYVYLYRYEKCKGGNDAKDKDNDNGYGDGKGDIEEFDNKADSIVNTTKSHVKFYNYPNYNKDAGDKGDSFCLGPGEWINRLQYYGDADGSHDWWKNSISSHRKVKSSSCSRWFGWGSNRSGLAAGAARGDRDGDDKLGVDTGLLYNDPNSTSRDDEIVDHIERLILGAEEGSDITIAAHFFGDWRIREALSGRVENANIRVIVDGGVSMAPGEEENYDEFYELWHQIGGDMESSEWIEHCRLTRACIGEGKMHNKFFLFEKTRGVDNVVVQTSANLKEGGSGTDMWNTSYTVAHAGLYKHYLAYFEDLRVGTPNDRYYEDNELPPAGGKYAVYHSPRQGGNTAMDLLDKVDCTKQSDTGGTQPGNRTIVRVAMWMISGEKWTSTGTQLARKLNYMDDQGYYVDVVVNTFGTGEGGNDGSLEALLRKPKGKYHGPEVREFYNSKNGFHPGLHSKDILIDGYYDGEPDQKVVITGTYNLTYKSVRVNDETVLLINDTDVHDEFTTYYFDVRQDASLTWQTSRYKR
ncbi:MAG: phospholipase D-like domain-containing protein [Actinopolymorphaceae bacterium]